MRACYSRDYSNIQIYMCNIFIEIYTNIIQGGHWTRLNDMKPLQTRASLTSYYFSWKCN